MPKYTLTQKAINGMEKLSRWMYNQGVGIADVELNKIAQFSGITNAQAQTIANYLLARGLIEEVTS